jgi:hypothetical protein
VHSPLYKYPVEHNFPRVESFPVIACENEPVLKMMESNHHLNRPRLFDLSQVGPRHSSVILTREEQDHLIRCPECQDVLALLTGFSEHKPTPGKSQNAA